MRQTIQLSHVDALRVLEVARQLIEQDGRGAAVAVTDAHGELLAFLRLDGCPLAPINNAINKAFTAAREGIESKAIGDRSREEDWPLSNFGDPRYIGWGGGVPLIVDGVVVGAVGVSGLPESDDMVIARAAAAALTGG